MFKKFRENRKHKKKLKNVQSEVKSVADKYIRQQKAIKKLRPVMTKREFVKIANKEGYDTHYSGKGRRFFVNPFENFRQDLEFEMLIKEDKLLSMYYK